MKHVKPHGAMYNLAAKDKDLADAIARAVYDFSPALVLVGLAGSELIEAGKGQGLRTAREAFADRTYQADGTLTDRNHPEAVIVNSTQAGEQALRIVLESNVQSLQGVKVPIEADTICIHGDTPFAYEIATGVRERLHAAGVEIRSMGQV